MHADRRIRSALPSRGGRRASFVVGTLFAAWFLSGAAVGYGVELQPITVKLQVFVGDAPPAAKPQYDWIVENQGARYPMHVMSLVVLTPSTVSAEDIQRALQPYPVALVVTGEAKALDTFRQAKSGQMLELQGIMRLAPLRYLMLARAQLLP